MDDLISFEEKRDKTTKHKLLFLIFKKAKVKRDLMEEILNHYNQLLHDETDILSVIMDCRLAAYDIKTVPQLATVCIPAFIKVNNKYKSKICSKAIILNPGTVTKIIKTIKNRFKSGIESRIVDTMEEAMEYTRKHIPKDK